MKNAALIESLGREDGQFDHTDLRSEFAVLGPNMERWTAGLPNEERLEILWLPDQQRAGVAWGSDAQWTDACSPKDALLRFLDGEMEV